MQLEANGSTWRRALDEAAILITGRKICIVAGGHWSDVMGGAQYQTMLLVRALAASGCRDITYITKKTNEHYRPEDHEIVTIRNPWNVAHCLSLDAMHVYNALKRAAPQVVYHRGSTAYSGPVAYYAHKMGIRSVWHISSTADVTPFQWKLSRAFPLRFVDRKLYEYSLRHTDVIVAQTADQARLLEENHGLRATAIIPNFHPLPEEDICKASPPEVVWIGNLKPLKQPEVFARAAADLQKLTDARFIMVGALQGSRRWQRAVRSAIDEVPNLSYRGACTQQEVNELLARAAVLVNTSLWEGFSNTFIQAWMRRVPVVSLNINPDGIFSPGRLGLHSGSEEQMKTDILRLINDEALRDAMGTEAQTYAIRNHSESNIARLIELMLC